MLNSRQTGMMLTGPRSAVMSMTQNGGKGVPTYICSCTRVTVGLVLVSLNRVICNLCDNQKGSLTSCPRLRDEKNPERYSHIMVY